MTSIKPICPDIMPLGILLRTCFIMFSAEGIICVEKIANPETWIMEMCRDVLLSPEVASVGMTEEAAKPVTM